MLASLKGWLAKLKDSPDTEVDLSRRRVLKGAAGLAAVAVVASAGGLKLLTADENSRLIDMIKSGVVENQTFYLDRTAVFEGLDGLMLRNCSFIAAPGFIGNSLIILKDATNIVLTNCFFDSTGITDQYSTAITLQKGDSHGKPTPQDQWLS